MDKVKMIGDAIIDLIIEKGMIEVPTSDYGEYKGYLIWDDDSAKEITDFVNQYYNFLNGHVKESE